MLKAIVLIGSLLLNAQAFACSCVQQSGDINEAVVNGHEHAAAVILAKAIKVDETSVGGTLDEPYVLTYETTQFSTIHRWKGSLGDQFSTRVETTCCICGYSFQQGEVYLLYLDGPNEDGQYTASICSRTQPLNAALEDLEVLNRLTPEDVFVIGSDPSTSAADQ